MNHPIVVRTVKGLFFIEKDILLPINKVNNRKVIFLDTTPEHSFKNKLETLDFHVLQSYSIWVETKWEPNDSPLWKRLFNIVNNFYRVGLTQLDFSRNNTEHNALEHSEYNEYFKLPNSMIPVRNYPSVVTPNHQNIFKYKDTFFTYNFDFHSKSLKEVQDYFKMLNM